MNKQTTMGEVWHLAAIVLAVGAIMLTLAAGTALAAGDSILRNCYEDEDPCLGSDNPETIVGTEGPDTIKAMAGDDKVYGQKDMDVIYGGSGNDHLLGELGYDTIYGGGEATTSRRLPIPMPNRPTR